MATFTTTRYGVPLEVEYTIERGYAATREEPGMPDYIEELYVRLADHDVLELLAASVVEAIEQECYDHANNAAADDYDEPEYGREDPPF